MKTELKRELGTWAAASIVVGTVIGSGIFLVPKTMMLNVGTPSLVFIVWVVGGFLSLLLTVSFYTPPRPPPSNVTGRLRHVTLNVTGQTCKIPRVYRGCNGVTGQMTPGRVPPSLALNRSLNLGFGEDLGPPFAS